MAAEAPITAKNGEYSGLSDILTLYISIYIYKIKNILQNGHLLLWCLPLKLWKKATKVL